MENIKEQITDIMTQINAIQYQLKVLEKTVTKEMKKKPVEKDRKKPSGFAKPSKITNELCEFMNKEEGTTMARTDVTKTIIEYIKKNNLQQMDNKQIIQPDEKLKTLLGINEDDKLTYFTLQKYMNKHFVKNKTNEAKIESVV
jgi:upstream activation factor subunit UAF30